MSKKVLVLVDLVDDIKNKEYHVYAYRHSVVASHYKSLGYELFHADERIMDELTDLQFDGDINFSEYDEIVVTMNTSSYWLNMLENHNVEFIYEDGDAYEKLVTRAIDNDNCKLVVVPSINSVKVDSDKLLEIDFVYDESLEVSFDEPEYLISMYANNYYKEREQKLRDSGLLNLSGFYLSGKGWDTLNGEFTYIGSQDLMTCSYTSFFSIVDISSKYKEYNLLPRKLVELLYKGMIPVVPRIPRSIEVFGRDYPFMYDESTEWCEVIKNLNNLTMHREIIEELRLKFKTSYSLPSKMLS